MVEIHFYRKPHYIKTFSKQLKRNQTLSEYTLRNHLKAKQLHGLKFHRQKPIFVYREESGRDRFFIADFYHHPSRLIIEIDGSIHNKKENKAYDKLREYLLQESGYHILRFTNDMVLSDIDNVLTTITTTILTILNNPPPSPSILEGFRE